MSSPMSTTPHRPQNKAAWLQGVKKYPLHVAEAPYTEPGPDEIVIRNYAIALNPADFMTQHQGNLMFPWIKYPFILGTDIAGEVVQVGSQVSQEGPAAFTVGDRVAAFAAGVDEKRNRACEGAFQLYTVVAARMATKIPDGMSWENAAVLPMGVTTAAAALFQQDQLALRYPTNGLDERAQDKEKGIVIIWGGSTSIGCNAIQLAVAAGYEVITTCSPKNNDALKSLGAASCFDYGSESVAKDIIKSCEGRTVVGAVAIGHDSGFKCMDILSGCDDGKAKSGGNGGKFVSMITYPITNVIDPSMLRMGTSYALGSARLRLKASITGCKYKAVFSSNIIHEEVSGKVWNEFLTQALARAKYKTMPAAQVVGNGLESIQNGMEILKKGVSMKKLVITID